jgi:hypothetical protein
MTSDRIDPLPSPEFEVFTANDGKAAIRYTPPSPPSGSVRRAELEARAALEAHDPDAWELVRVAHARRKMAERNQASNG